MSWSDGIDEADGNATNGNYLKPGQYRVQIKAAKAGINRKKRDFFLYEIKILKTSNETNHPVGSTATCYYGIQPDVPAILNDVKASIATMLNANPKEVNKGVAELVVSSAQPLAGTIVDIAASLIEKQKSEGVFTKYEYTLVEAAPKAA